HDSMYNSNVVTANYIILDTSSLVALPFDISGNSDSTHADIKYMPGFRSNKLGTSYANGSAKFESKNAGSATLIAHLDSSPGTLSFDLKGMKSGTPSSYNGITFLVSESADGIQWTTVVSLNESDISSEEFSHFEEIPLAASTRYIRWLLASATNGNTQLNDIIITRQPVDTSDDSGIDDHGSDVPAPYPNPASTVVRWNLCEDAQMVQLYNESGALIRQWNNVPNGDDFDISGISPGLYILQAKTNVGKATKKLIIK
ncbi:MAG: T9SS type A sorting domain-containing protein, partial [Bacteroidales bacterium]|nr:T9SS type A sorting domain-containing protein [Bacteroidales bacterium]